MLGSGLRKTLFLIVTALIASLTVTTAWAEVSGIGAIASNVTHNLAAIAKLITAGSYVAGMAFAVGAVAKFKQHKDNPTQIPLSTPIVLLFVGIALIFIPAIFQAGGGTLFKSSGVAGGISGITSF
ncbi:MAG TPA: type IV secretion protein IcmD [Gammaproteobacteria bacterium]|nr:type IV secretion protein IcmD [Gammaproteobacteria bacterium]